MCITLYLFKPCKRFNQNVPLTNIDWNYVKKSPTNCLGKSLTSFDLSHWISLSWYSSIWAEVEHHTCAALPLGDIVLAVGRSSYLQFDIVHCRSPATLNCMKESWITCSVQGTCTTLTGIKTRKMWNLKKDMLGIYKAASWDTRIALRS